MLPPFAAVLLAGGRSVRMGQDKAWLDRSGTPLWEHQLQKLLALHPRQTLLSCRPEQGIPLDFYPGVEAVYDPPGDSGHGPLPALARCLELVACPLLVLAVDMPGMTVGYLRTLLEQAHSTGHGLIYETVQGYEPLGAVYPPAVLPLLQAQILQGDYRLQHFVRLAVQNDLMTSMPLPAEQATYYFNMNEPADQAQAWTHPPA